MEVPLRSEGNGARGEGPKVIGFADAVVVVDGDDGDDGDEEEEGDAAVAGVCLPRERVCPVQTGARRCRECPRARRQRHSAPEAAVTGDGTGAGTGTGACARRHPLECRGLPHPAHHR